MHYYKHSIGDYRRDTMHLTLLEHGVYRQLLDLYYLNECELDANALRLICARSAEEIEAAESILKEFFIETENGWKHARCDKEIDAFHAKSEKAKASADARWKAKSKGKNANGMRTHSEGNANHKPITINHKPIKKSKKKELHYDDYPEFCEFWNAYPNKDKKYEALSIWAGSSFPIQEILNALDWQTNSEKWLEAGGKFVPLPTTYLNQKRWQDEPPKQGAAF